jgi:beta-lactam-binding protein with PASTA domain
MRLLRYILLSLVLLLIFVASALIAMRSAIHGRQVEVPRLSGLTPQQAQRLVNDRGLLLNVENSFYSSEVPAGRVLSQLPPPGTLVRKGWQVRVAQSLGPQRVNIPDVVGQSRRLAEINLKRHGLEVGNIVVMNAPAAAPDQVLAQTPAANAQLVSAPKVDLLVSAASENPR